MNAAWPASVDITPPSPPSPVSQKPSMKMLLMIGTKLMGVVCKACLDYIMAVPEWDILPLAWDQLSPEMPS